MSFLSLTISLNYDTILLEGLFYEKNLGDCFGHFIGRIVPSHVFVFSPGNFAARTVRQSHISSVCGK